MALLIQDIRPVKNGSAMLKLTILKHKFQMFS